MNFTRKSNSDDQLRVVQEEEAMTLNVYVHGPKSVTKTPKGRESSLDSAVRSAPVTAELAKARDLALSLAREAGDVRRAIAGDASGARGRKP
jgi:hypothetical protein